MQWSKSRRTQRTPGVPVDVRDVAGRALADADALAAQHVVDVNEVVMRCHGQVLPWIYTNTQNCTSVLKYQNKKSWWKAQL